MMLQISSFKLKNTEIITFLFQAAFLYVLIWRNQVLSFFLVTEFELKFCDLFSCQVRNAPFSLNVRIQLLFFSPSLQLTVSLQCSGQHVIV